MGQIIPGICVLAVIIFISVATGVQFPIVSAVLLWAVVAVVIKLDRIDRKLDNLLKDKLKKG